jgi:hypothetical protein
MEIAVDPVDLVLARRPVARDGVDVTVDQARRHRGALGVDNGGRAFDVDVLEAADRGDLAVLCDDGVAVQDRLFQGAGQDQADIADHELRGPGGLGCVMRHGRGPFP